MFDLTKEVVLEDKWQKPYLYLRLALYVVFVLASIYFFYYVFFNKRIPLYADGTLQGNNIYSAYTVENFSDAKFQLFSDGQNVVSKNNQILVRKTYKAFAYPSAAQPAGFPDGSLVKNEGRYYIVSNGQLRQFASPQLAGALGYEDNAFQSVTTDELNYNAKGDDIASSQNYPNDSLFVIDGKYYQLENQTLTPFVSEHSFLSRFDKTQAIAKDKDFLQNFVVGQQPLGFANGSLLSFADGAFIVVDNKVMPFSNPDTFLSFGYQWPDIIPATDAEIGLYPRDKIFAVNLPHPDGTVFLAQDTGKYYLVNQGQKQQIAGDDILKMHLKKSPILVSEKSLEFQDACVLKKEFLSTNAYQCTLPVENLAQFAGNAYQFSVHGVPSDAIARTDMAFARNLSLANARLVLLGLRNKVLVNYNMATPN